MQDVSRKAGEPGFRDEKADRFAAQLEMVSTEPAVPEVAQRPEHLVPSAGTVPVAIPTAHDQRLDVLEPWCCTPGAKALFGAKLAHSHLEEGRVADDRVPFALPDPPQVALVQCRIHGRVDR